MKRNYKAKNDFIIIKEYKPMGNVDLGEDLELDKQKFLEGHIETIGKNVDEEEFKVGMLVRCAEYVAGYIGEDFYHVQASDIACVIEMIDE